MIAIAFLSLLPFVLAAPFPQVQAPELPSTSAVSSSSAAAPTESAALPPPSTGIDAAAIEAAQGANFLFQQGLSIDTPCSPQQRACISGGLAVCSDDGAFVVVPCRGQTCAALPDASGVIVACRPQDTIEALFAGGEVAVDRGFTAPDDYDPPEAGVVQPPVLGGGQGECEVIDTTESVEATGTATATATGAIPTFEATLGQPFPTDLISAEAPAESSSSQVQVTVTTTITRSRSSSVAAPTETSSDSAPATSTDAPAATSTGTAGAPPPINEVGTGFIPATSTSAAAVIGGTGGVSIPPLAPAPTASQQPIREVGTGFIPAKIRRGRGGSLFPGDY